MKRLLLLIFVGLLLPDMLLSQHDCEITYVANEGFVVETGGRKVLIDALFDHIDGNWCDSPNDSILNLLVNALAPFDQVDLVLITHHHRDHFNESIVAQYLKNNKTCGVVCPIQVKESLSQNKDYPLFTDRVVGITPSFFQDTLIMVVGIPITIMRLEHSYYMEWDSLLGETVNRHRDVENLGFIFQLNGLTFFHCGDTNPLNEREYSTYHLQEKAIDVAFLERLFFSSGQVGQDIVNQYIQPKNTIIMHINPVNKPLFLDHFKDVETTFVFNQPLDKRKISF